MMFVEKAKTKRIKDHKIISLTLKQCSEMNNRKTQVFWLQSEARTAATVWN